MLSKWYLYWNFSRIDERNYIFKKITKDFLKRRNGVHTRIMMKFKKTLPILLSATLLVSAVPFTVKADGTKVVTLGANLSEDQRASMYEYFGTSADQVDTIEVTNADERKYMEGIASEAQIGTRTFSCSYVEPTTEGGIQVKVANLTFVTSSMIASTLMTSGVENCNVVAASPIEVSGTGALTGIMMAYEVASGEELSEEQKETATEELITTGELADTIGTEEATQLMSDVKQKVIEKGLEDPETIETAVTDAADELGVTISDEQMAKIVALMEKIAQYDYDVNALKDTLNNLAGKSEGFFSNLLDSIKGFFGGNDSDAGILNGTNDDALGADAIIDSTIDTVKEAANSEEAQGLFDKIVNWVKGLVGSDDSSSDADTSTED